MIGVQAQRFEALERANEVRFGIAALRREISQLDLAAGCDRVADLIEQRDVMTGAARVGWIVRAIPRVGAQKSSGILNRADIRSYDVHIRDLTERRRLLLIEQLRRDARSARRASARRAA